MNKMIRKYNTSYNEDKKCTTSHSEVIRRSELVSRDQSHFRNIMYVKSYPDGILIGSDSLNSEYHRFIGVRRPRFRASFKLSN